MKVRSAVRAGGKFKTNNNDNDDRNAHASAA
jgi:hypothetical protein